MYILLFDDIINTQNLDLSEIKIDKNSDKNIYYIGNVTVKNLSYTKINGVNLFYLIIYTTKRYTEESNEKIFDTDSY